MPRLVDAESRRDDVAGAVWRVVARDGLDGASVRAVAAEAGLSAGSLRHWFTAQSDLHVFAMTLVVERIRSRAGALALSAEPLEAAASLLEQFLPLDPERALESEVWLAFTARSPVARELRRVREQAYDDLFDVCRGQVQGLLGNAISPATVESEAHRLNALIDGLLVHGVIRPERASPEVLRSVLRAHLEQMRLSHRNGSTKD